jgi:hypothetical protein
MKFRLSHRILSVTVLLLLGTVIWALPLFFGYVERRDGILLGDPFLERMPAGDFSIAIALLLYVPILWFTGRAIRQPLLFLHYLWAYAIMLCLRMICMWALPLEAPPGFLEIQDPIQQFFYGGQEITKDLFFSGHTATVLMAALILPGPSERRILFATTIALAFFLLAQRVHYTVDVLVAFPAAWLSVWIAGRIIRGHKGS